MLKDSLYAGLHGPLSLAELLTRIEQRPTLTLSGVLRTGSACGTKVELLHRTTQARHTLLYSLSEEPGMLHLLAVQVTESDANAVAHAMGS